MSRVALIEGWLAPLSEPASGEPTLQKRLQSIGVDARIFMHTDSAGVYKFLHGYPHFIAIGGDSLGAGAALRFAQDLMIQDVDFVFGFQPSMDDPLVHHGVIAVPENVKLAMCIYDPYWIDTLGLGQAHYEIVPNTGSKLITIQHRSRHPDDWGWAQDQVYIQIKSLLEQRHDLR